MFHLECLGAVVRAPALESQGCEFSSHWVSTLVSDLRQVCLPKVGLGSLSRKMITWLRTVSTVCTWKNCLVAPVYIAPRALRWF